MRTKPPSTKWNTVHKRKVTFILNSIIYFQRQIFFFFFSILRNVNVIIEIMAYVQISYSPFFLVFHEAILFALSLCRKRIDNCQPNRNDWMIAKFWNFSLSPHLIWHEKLFLVFLLFFFSFFHSFLPNNWVWCVCVFVVFTWTECRQYFEQQLCLLIPQALS